MDYGAIIKRSWQITWRHKAMWVLGIFAGISGCQGGGGGGGNGGGGSGSGDSQLGSRLDSLPDWGRQADRLADYIPVIAAGVLLLLVLWIVWFVLGIAARGGLVKAVSEVEDGREFRLSEMWAAGFSRWGSLFGLGFLLGLPVLIGGLTLLALIIVPLVPLIRAGSEPDFSSFIPMIGAVCLGIPVLALLGVLCDVLRLLGLRHIMLGGQGAVGAIKSAWGLMRARFKDTFLMYLINGALNIGAGIVLAIPIVVVVVAMIIPGALAVKSENWGLVIGSAVGAAAIISVFSMLFNAIWGTFTSSLWTLMFRSATGMEPAAVGVPAGSPLPVRPAPAYPTAPAPAAPQPPAQQPAQWVPPAPPTPPQTAPEPPPGPPIAGYSAPAAPSDEQPPA